jgi:hypothetical protein
VLFDLVKKHSKNTKMRATLRQLGSFYFTPLIPNDDGTKSSSEWDCNKCGKTKLKSRGWTNLLNHARSCVGTSFQTDYERLHNKDREGRITSFIIRVNKTEKEMFRWIEWIVVLNQPLSIVDDPLTRDGMRFKPITSKLLRRNILALCKEMQTSIKHRLPDKFSIIFDGWTEGTIHYIGVSAAYVNIVEGVEVVTQTVLSMRPLLKDDIKGMTAQDHLHHLSIILGTYGKSDTDIVYLIGNNCSVNQGMSKILKAPLIGCGSHKFNLAVRQWISNQPQLKEIIQRIAIVMKKASTLKVSAHLRKLTTLKTIRENDTRWSSTFMMVKRFFRIQQELSAVPDLIPLIPNLLEVDLLAKAFMHLKAFNQITVLLPEEGITFVGRRDVFDSVLEDYPELSGHLCPDAKIVVDAIFEKAVIWIAKGLVLTTEQ